MRSSIRRSRHAANPAPVKSCLPPAAIQYRPSSTASCVKIASTSAAEANPGLRASLANRRNSCAMTGSVDIQAGLELRVAPGQIGGAPAMHQFGGQLANDRQLIDATVARRPDLVTGRNQKDLTELSAATLVPASEVGTARVARDGVSDSSRGSSWPNPS